jgi:hypothetical protein
LWKLLSVHSKDVVDTSVHTQQFTRTICVFGAHLILRSVARPV